MKLVRNVGSYKLLAKQETYDILIGLPKAKQYDDKFIIGFYDEKQTIMAAIDLIKDYPVVSQIC